MITRILVIHHQLAFAVTLKRSLEKVSGFEVYPFTSLDSALEYLQTHAHDVAFVDFDMADTPGPIAVSRLRKVQPTIGIIATPRPTDEVMTRLHIQGGIDIPFNVRDLVPMIREIMATGVSVQDDMGMGKDTDRLPTTDTIKPRAAKLKLPPKETDKKPPPPDTKELWRRLESISSEPHTQMTEEEFRGVLDSIDMGDVRGSKEETDEFSALIRSLQNEEKPQPFPVRQQQVVELIINDGNEADDVPTPPPSIPLKEDPPKTTKMSSGLLRASQELSRIKQEEQVAKPKDTQKFSDEATDKVFETLAKHEPPLPSFEESGTISDLVASVNATPPEHVNELEQLIASIESAQPTVSIWNWDDVTPQPPETETPAKLVLQESMDESTPLDSFSISQLIASIERQLPAHKPKLQAPPSWIREGEARRLARTEEDYFSESLLDTPEGIPLEGLDVSEADGEFSFDNVIETLELGTESVVPPLVDGVDVMGPEEYDHTTIGRGPIENPNEYPTEAIYREWEYAPTEAEVVDVPPSIPEELPDEDYSFCIIDDDTRDVSAVIDEATVFEPLVEGLDSDRYGTPDRDVQDTDSEVFQIPLPEVPPVDAPASAPAQPRIDPFEEYIANLALSLTEVSLELTAEATMLSRGEDIVAYAGRMPDEDVTELGYIVAGDWDAGDEGARIRFITIPASGKDYLLYGRRTANDFTLTLVFAGTTPLRDIRRQSKRLLEALAEIPEVEVPLPDDMITEEGAESELFLPPQQTIINRAMYAYVWLLRDANLRIPHDVAQAILSGLSLDLASQNWVVQDFQIADEYVYLLAEIPDVDMPYTVVDSLKARSAEIAASMNPAFDAQTMWANSYLIVAPGRPLTVDDIGPFIEFERML